MAGLQTRQEPKIGPSDSSDTYSDRPEEASTDSDSGATGERVTIGRDPHAGLHAEQGADRVVDARDAGLGGGLDQAEEAQLGVTDEEIEAAAGEIDADLDAGEIDADLDADDIDPEELKTTKP
jgi:hypothetical protein